MKSWYFAYGSNLLVEQLIERTGGIGRAGLPPRIARLANHRLLFQPLTAGGHSFANIGFPGEGVFGVVYHFTPEDYKKLDPFEGGYRRKFIQVRDQMGEILPAFAYFVKSGKTNPTGSPTGEYLTKIVNGARQHGLPEEYIRSIIATATLVIP